MELYILVFQVMKPLGLPPNERPNWHRLNEGQRRYAWEQYNLAKVRRGIQIDHPIPAVDPAPHQVSGEHADALAELERETAQDLVPADELDRIADEFEEHQGMPSTQSRVSSSSQPIASSSAAGQHTGEAPSAKRARVDGESVLPGTGQAQGGRPEGLEGGPRSIALPRPTSGLHSQIRHYRKVHRVLTYGIAYHVVQNNFLPNNKTSFITTPFCNVPWDRPYLYLNVAEWSVLPEGAHVVKCRVRVHNRNTRIAFPTNASESNLATLNQNKNIVVAEDFNRKVHSVNCKYTMGTTDQPMIPSALTLASDADHRSISNDAYGVAIIDPSATVQVPRHQMGIPQVFPLYAAIPNIPSNSPSTNAIAGWPLLQEHYREIDGDTSTGNMIHECEYHPICGLLKKPPLALYTGLTVGAETGNRNVTVPRNTDSRQQHFSRMIVNHADGMTQSYTEDQLDGDNINGDSQSTVPNWDNVTLIEKSQYIHFGQMNPQGAQVQPSLHVGVQPTPALTTKAFEGTSNSSFTDTQAYFEIVAECEINCNYPTEYPYPLRLHTSEYANVYASAWSPVTSYSCFNGMYQGTS